MKPPRMCVLAHGGDRQSGDGQVGGPYSSPGDPGNPMPEPDDSDSDD
ncbi:hypothetical protein [Streptomyces cyaneofuscatus]